MIERRKVDGPDVQERSEFGRKVFIGEVEIVEVGGGINREEVKTKAAEQAVRILKARKLGRDGGAEATDVDEMHAEDGEGGMRMDIDKVMNM